MTSSAENFSTTGGSTGGPENVKKEEQMAPVAPVETVLTKENVLDKGRERYEKAAEAITNAKASISSWFSRAGDKVTSFWERTKKNVVDGAKGTVKGAIVGAFAAPQILELANNTVDKAYVDHIEAPLVGAYDAGVEYAGIAKKWANAKYEQAAKFVSEKKDRVVQIGSEIARGTAFLGALAVGVTREGIKSAGESIKSGYGAVVEYGNGAVAAGKAGLEKCKTGLNNKWNALKIKALEFRARSQAEAYEKNAMKTEEARVALEKTKQDLEKLGANTQLLTKLSGMAA
jgi:hypothetical protein